MFCTIFVPLYKAKILKKHVRSSSFLVQVFFRENSYSHEKLKAIASIVILHEFFRTDIFQQKLKPGDRL